MFSEKSRIEPVSETADSGANPLENPHRDSLPGWRGSNIRTPPWDPGNADSYEDRALFASVALSSLSSLLFSLFSALFSRRKDHFDLIFEALGPLKRRKSMQKVIKFKVFGVLALARPSNPEKHPKTIPRAPKALKTSPKRDPGAPKGDPRAPKERPQSVPIGPSVLQEVCGIAFGRLRTSFWSF